MFRVFILYEIFIFLVDRVVCKMHVFVILVELGSVCLRSKSSQTFFVNVDPEWLIAGYHHIDSQIELIPVDQQRVRNVSRNDT